MDVVFYYCVFLAMFLFGVMSINQVLGSKPQGAYDAAATQHSLSLNLLSSRHRPRSILVFFVWVDEQVSDWSSMNL